MRIGNPVNTPDKRMTICPHRLSVGFKATDRFMVKRHRGSSRPSSLFVRRVSRPRVLSWSCFSHENGRTTTRPDVLVH